MKACRAALAFAASTRPSEDGNITRKSHSLIFHDPLREFEKHAEHTSSPVTKIPKAAALSSTFPIDCHPP